MHLIRPCVMLLALVAMQNGTAAGVRLIAVDCEAEAIEHAADPDAILGY